MSRIAVITVNYGTAELALAAVGSVLERAHPGHEVEVHLVDNASPGGDAARIAAEIAARGWENRVTFHPEAENHGFGRGNNVVLRQLAARETPPDYVFLLNPDAALENEAVAILADFMDAHPEAACAGSGSRRPDQTEPARAAFRFPGMASTFADAVNFGPVAWLFDRYMVPLPPSPVAMRVDWVEGSGLMGRLAAWQEVGFFDPTYFLYYEEVDMMLQLARAGWACWYVPEAKVIHMAGAATGVNSGDPVRKRRPSYVYDSWRHYFVKNHGRAYALTTAVVWILGGTLGVMVAAVMRRKPMVPLNFAGDILRGIVIPVLNPLKSP